MPVRRVAAGQSEGNSRGGQFAADHTRREEAGQVGIGGMASGIEWPEPPTDFVNADANGFCAPVLSVAPGTNKDAADELMELSSAARAADQGTWSSERWALDDRVNEVLGHTSGASGRSIPGDPAWTDATRELTHRLSDQDTTDEEARALVEEALAVEATQRPTWDDSYAPPGEGAIVSGHGTQYECWAGANNDQTPGMSNADIAKEVRAELKRAAEAGYIPACLEYSVRSSAYSVDVQVKGLQDRWREVEVTDDGDGFGRNTRPTAQAVELKRRVDGIRQAWNHDASDVMTDYFDVGYYGSTDLHEWNPNMSEAATQRRLKRAERAAAAASRWGLANTNAGA